MSLLYFIHIKIKLTLQRLKVTSCCRKRVQIARMSFELSGLVAVTLKADAGMYSEPQWGSTYSQKHVLTAATPNSRKPDKTWTNRPNKIETRYLRDLFIFWNLWRGNWSPFVLLVAVFSIDLVFFFEGKRCVSKCVQTTLKRLSKSVLECVERPHLYMRGEGPLGQILCLAKNL